MNWDEINLDGLETFEDEQELATIADQLQYRPLHRHECAGCGNLTGWHDVVGIGWCEQCRWRGQVVNWLAAHDWPYLYCTPFAIGPGQELCVRPLLYGDATLQAMMAEYIDWIDRDCGGVVPEQELPAYLQQKGA